MHSSELPITDWWDPEWDTYDVPLTPNDDFWQTDLSPDHIAAWWAAYNLLWDIRWVMHGSAEYRPDFRGRELTQHAYPGQPATRTRPPTKPCCCAYVAVCCGDVLNGTLWLVGPGQWCEYTQAWGHAETGFRIHPDCPHHGREVMILNPALPAELTIEALWNDPALNVMRDPYDLDDNERH